MSKTTAASTTIDTELAETIACQLFEAAHNAEMQGHLKIAASLISSASKLSIATMRKVAA